MPSRAETLARIRELRKSGKTGFSNYEIQEAEDLYETVDEEGYKKVVRSRLDQDDFVVDDNGAGYADDGREDWENGQQDDYTESEDELPARGKPAKRKREEDAEKQEKIKNGINKYFSANAAIAAPKPKATRTLEDDAFMADILGNVDTNVASSRTRAVTKPIKSENRRKTRVLSPGLDDLDFKHLTATSEHTQMETPPRSSQAVDDNDLPMIDDAPMSDGPLPSSPVAKVVQRKEQAIKQEEEDEDMLEVSEATGHDGVPTASVNIRGSRPAPKIMKKPDLPTPMSSSPPQAAADVAAATASWANVTDKLSLLSSPQPESAAMGKLQAKDVVEQDGSLHMFWTDYTEINGSLCLFGKVKDKTSGGWASSFVKIDNIMRKLYFLPREYRHKHGKDTAEEVDMGAVYEEVDALMSKQRVTMHKIKPCSRKYAFEMPGIPKEADYLKLFYPYDKPTLPSDLKGETFSHIFGTNTALFEQFVLWKGIMGPCWIKIEGANFNAVNNASWCKLELQADQPKLITALGDSDNLDAPPLTLMSVAMRTIMNEKTNKQELFVASARVYENVSLTDTTPPEKLPSRTFTVMRPNGEYPMGFKLEVEKHRGLVKMEKSEQGLLSVFMALLQRADPDVLVGHKLDDVDYSLLLNRMREHKTPGWHRIGRLKRSEWPKNMGKGGGSFFVERQLAAGRLHCDLANDFGRSNMRQCQSWSLDEMCETVLGGDNKRRDLDYDAALRMATSRAGLMNFVKLVEADTYFIAAIALKVQLLPLSKVLTNLAGNSWARTLSGTRAERNEFILLHEFTRNKYIVPDKTYGRAKVEEQQEGDEEGEGTKKKDKYKGGLVFEPEKGLYDKFVLVMDFNSLYPSIIQEFNICFTTVDRNNAEDDDDVPEVPTDTANKGILPRLIRTLVSRRREVKKLMKDKSATADQIQTWDIKQAALKLTANSMYGCLGYTKSRFYARPLAMLTTAKGREILQSTKDLAESTHGLRVIYGDTDSVMVNTNVDNLADAMKIGNDFKKAVNERYELLEIDIDNIFRRLLLHAKKKYAALNMTEKDGKWFDKLEVKGLDMRRREYCQLSKETSSNLLDFLLSGEENETVVTQIHDYLRDLAAKMRSQSIPANKYTIFTQLGKEPKDYPNGASMPSVQVALKLMARGKRVKAKDVMSFVICGSNDGKQESAAQNAYPMDEVLSPEFSLKPDIDYYLHKQILPPVERLCAPISGTNVTLLAECLGLDTTKYRVQSSSSAGISNDPQIHPLESQIPDHLRFKDCVPLSLLCLTCRSRFQYSGLASTAETLSTLPSARVTNAGLTCPCGSVLPPLSVTAQLEAAIRAHTSRYSAAWLRCDEPTCATRTRQMSVYGRRCLGPKGLAHGCAGKMGYEFGAKELYTQLLYLRGMFDCEKTIGRIEKPGGIKVEDMEGEGREKMKVLVEMNRERWEGAKGVVDGYLERSGWGWVSMEGLFGFALKMM
ncbi:DNA polymerase alpha subunit A [Myriangium duriaei CBS 260.36]|uniref:DNA polymerase n=1 Tax=Myriangium duriaei CBS 260.36 TaxID=1168546 RepID=A0A9P4J2T3_9PEZI|nr:DNA polymerase alpha subunit A [Myriangium duriaei CBS 260.36]